MYKCLNCGNTEKFIGFAEEKGKAYIYQDCTECSWAYMISDKNWTSSIDVSKCFYCNSEKIVKIK
jgi:DNA-directed RNA polymerase subunit RPC12/RpoP